MNTPDPSQYRAPPWALDAEWIVEERDLHAATTALPGSTLGILRWPLAFFLAYVGVGLADPRVGAPFALGSGAVITGAWLVVSLGQRGTSLRQIARLPEQRRATRLSIDGDRIRHQSASGHAGEYPLSDLTRVKVCSSGILLDVRGQVLFVPTRAMQGNEQAWTAFASRLTARDWPRRAGLTVGVWCFAALVAVYALAK